MAHAAPTIPPTASPPSTPMDAVSTTSRPLTPSLTIRTTPTRPRRRPSGPRRARSQTTVMLHAPPSSAISLTSSRTSSRESPLRRLPIPPIPLGPSTQAPSEDATSASPAHRPKHRRLRRRSVPELPTRQMPPQLEADPPPYSTWDPAPPPPYADMRPAHAPSMRPVGYPYCAIRTAAFSVPHDIHILPLSPPMGPHGWHADALPAPTEPMPSRGCSALQG